MELNLNQFAFAVLGIACGCLGWFARQVWNAVQELKEDVHKLRVLLVSEYVRYDRLQDALKPVMERLQDIQHTLTGKADKP